MRPSWLRWMTTTFPYAPAVSRMTKRNIVFYSRMSGFEYDYTKMLLANGEPASAVTKNIYRAALNKIAMAGYPNRAALLKNPKQVIDFIKESMPEKAKQRVALSAIFKVIQDISMKNRSRNMYYKFFQTAKEDTREK